MPSIFNSSEFVGLTYRFILYLNSLNDNCFSYKFFDTVEKKIRDCKIYLPFSHFKKNGFEFQRIIPPQGKVNVSIRLFENNNNNRKTKQFLRMIIKKTGMFQI